MLLVVAIVGGAIFASMQEEVPEDFRFPEVKNDVEASVGGSCTSTYNSSSVLRYHFECCQMDPTGEYRYCVNARAEYNETGPDKVELY